MGSQSVTDFSAARKKQIQERIRAFDPAAREASSHAREAGMAAIGQAAPTSSFTQALTSASVDTAAKTLAGLVNALKTGPRSEQRIEEVLRSYGVQPSNARPYPALVAGLRSKLGEALNAASKKTEAAPAATDAVGRTILDVIARAFPLKKEPSEVTREELVDAIRRTPAPQFTTLFLRNLIASLLRETLDAARGEFSREHVDALVKNIETGLAKNLASKLTRTPKG